MSEEVEPAADAVEDLDWQGLFALLGRAHTKGICYELAVASDPPVRFGHLEDALDVAPNTLSRRLDELEAVSFVERTQYDEIPPRVEYEPTEKLLALEPAMGELERWMAEYGDGEVGPEGTDGTDSAG